MDFPALGQSQTCRDCGAINMPGRKSCFQCGRALGVPHGVGGPSLVPLTGPSPERGDRRRSPRQEAVPILVKMEVDGFPPQEASLRNLSAGGVAVLTDTAYPAGALVVLHIPIDGRSHKADGVVRYVNSLSGNGFQVGIEFMGSVPPLSHLRTR